MIKHDQLMCADNKNGSTARSRSKSFQPSTMYWPNHADFYMIFEVCGPNHIFT